MNLNAKTIITLFLLLCTSGALLAIAPEPPITVPAGIDHSAWDELLKKRVNATGLVDYSGWKKNPDDVKKLDRYLLQFAPYQKQGAQRNERAASLINAYNAFTIQWILRNYPTQSIRLLKNSWTAQRYRIGGRRLSLDQIEHGALRPLLGWKAHALIVCAARSCPPLQPFAYQAENLDQQISDAWRAWLARRDLNAYFPADNRVKISKIFTWFEDDFDKAGGTEKILAQFAPASYQRFLNNSDFKIKYQTYHWGLNDQSGLGQDYKHSIFDSLF